MKVLLFAGGFGTRLSEETGLVPKPMLEIGGVPILCHIMGIYSKYGYNDFIILCGYKGYMIKEYFANYYRHDSDMEVDLSNGSIKYLNNKKEPWKITLIDTGLHTMTAGRIKRVQHLVGEEPFMLTYGDGVSDVNIKDLVDFHKGHGKTVTMMSSQPEGRFGALNIDNNGNVKKFEEKPKGDGNWINSGYFVCEPKIFDYLIGGDDEIFEQEPLLSLAKDGELLAYKYSGFWKPMDTLKDKNDLNKLWNEGNATWISQ